MPKNSLKNHQFCICLSVSPRLRFVELNLDILLDYWFNNISLNDKKHVSASRILLILNKFWVEKTWHWKKLVLQKWKK